MPAFDNFSLAEGVFGSFFVEDSPTEVLIKLFDGFNLSAFAESQFVKYDLIVLCEQDLMLFAKALLQRFLSLDSNSLNKLKKIHK